MKIPPVKGTRDFYPPDMAVRNWIIDGWKRVSIRNGFEEYDGPIFEYLKMFQIKSGDEIVEQLFSLKDRGGRDLAIRPEITPTLARMVNQQINSLPRPIKWFSVPRLCRVREFFQWNIDIIGVDDVLADAEVIFTTLDYLRAVGLTSADIKVKISSRKLLASVLTELEIVGENDQSLYTLLDKKARLSRAAFNELLTEQVQDSGKVNKLTTFMELKSIPDVEKMFGHRGEVARANDELAMLIPWLERMGVAKYCEFDPSIVRGLAYYTGLVFEVHDIVGELRAICGGGRFDNLLQDFGGPQIPATGMGMGDCILEILLKQKGLLDKHLPTRQVDYFVAAVGADTFD
ncbi:MAG: ATP phosphoribosyltransferase regulatory subunit, partial [Planctomycetota bacterium]